MSDWALRRKYRVGLVYKGQTSYRTRTGPSCCNGGCGSNRKKGTKIAAGLVRGSA